MSTASTLTKNEEQFRYPTYRDTQGKLVYGIRMENTEPGHHKEYIVTVTERPNVANPKSVEYVVEGAWGPIGGTPIKQVKDIDGQPSTPHRARAIQGAIDLERAKKNKKYIEKLKFEEDETANAAPDDENADWVVTDDVFIDPTAPEAQAAAAQINRDCFCNTSIEELSNFAYDEPIMADLDVAPYLMSPGFGLVKFDETKRGPRWLVTVQSSCSAPYPEPHARAVPIGELMDDAKLGERKRVMPQYVEDLVIEALDDSRKRKEGFDFIVVIEEQSSVDLLVIDALRWNGESLVETPWEERRAKLDSDFSGVFKVGPFKRGRNVLLAPRITNRLREQYLMEGDKYRFELYPFAELPGGQYWQLPKL